MAKANGGTERRVDRLERICIEDRKRWAKSDALFRRSDAQFRKNDEIFKKNDEIFKKNDEIFKKNDARWRKAEEKSEARWQKNDERIRGMLEILIAQGVKQDAMLEDLRAQRVELARLGGRIDAALKSLYRLLEHRDG